MGISGLHRSLSRCKVTAENTLALHGALYGLLYLICYASSGEETAEYKWNHGHANSVEVRSGGVSTCVAVVVVVWAKDHFSLGIEKSVWVGAGGWGFSDLLAAMKTCNVPGITERSVFILLCSGPQT
jgi:hypothetical protein|mmetsp:Transcript_60855/g.100660  ORF Transcript_60855/g.100660 Transcript_60855/m.100660 type:complete len:127 (+) Transcript_60855:232-612(+)